MIEIKGYIELLNYEEENYIPVSKKYTEEDLKFIHPEDKFIEDIEALRGKQGLPEDFEIHIEKISRILH